MTQASNDKFDQRTDNQHDVGEQLNSLTKVALCSDEVLFTIQANGDWLYRNEPLPNKFARMFSQILCCEQGEFYLITPVEKVRVEVQAYPLLAVDFDSSVNDKGLFTLTTNLDTQFTVKPQDITVTDDAIVANAERGLSIQFNRASYYRYINEILSID
ncbi:DUF1285 domain-containing protein [Shewanella maritima]|uniref:DUF1285 domain-containing protein n=1 Tax=Shewanella maritima TaxID=2520507 RepID=A0A411PM14_9GAMM|nr:DUF1285 domain-containing protein [Shewanella maritima]QBF84531.1 DUF1285 domain-containing protein [Shewanella maritima]